MSKGKTGKRLFRSLAEYEREYFPKLFESKISENQVGKDGEGLRSANRSQQMTLDKIMARLGE